MERTDDINIDSNLARQIFLNAPLGIARVSVEGMFLEACPKSFRISLSCLMSQVYPNLDIIPAGRPASNTGELFVEGKLEQIVQWAADAYDIVLVDSPPVLPVNDAVVLSRLCDVTVFVARQEKVSYHEIEEAYNLFEKAGVSPDGMVFNNFVPSRIRYGISKYGYYAYRYGYGKYGRYRKDPYGYGLDQGEGQDVDDRPALMNKRLSRKLQKVLTEVMSKFRR